MRNKTKLFLISALSLCTLTAGITAVAASADDVTETTNVPTFTLKGTSIRLPKVENEVSDEITGVRFAVQMSTADWEKYSADIAETWVTISYDETVSAPVYTTNNWYTVDGEGNYVAENFEAYQATVVLYDIDEEYFTTEFKVQAFAMFQDSEEAIFSEAFQAKSMSQVAKEYAAENPEKIDGVKEYMFYTVSFDTDGGNAMQAVQVPYGTPASGLESEAFIPTKSGYEFVKWQVKVSEGQYIDVPAGQTVTQDLELKAVWNEIIYEASTFEQFATYASQNVKVKLTADIDASEAAWSGEGWDRPTSVIQTLNAQVDGNGHKLTIKKPSAWAPSYWNVGFIDTISATGVLKNIVVEATLEGYSGQAKMSLLAYNNSGTIENCYIKGSMLVGSDQWAYVAQNATCGTVVHNYGTMKNLLTDIKVEVWHCANHDGWGPYLRSSANQKFAFAVANLGRVENCLTVNGLAGGETSWMTSDIDLGTYANYAGGTYASIGSWTTTEAGYANHKDANRKNCYVFATYDALTAGTAKGDKYNGDSFDNTAFADYSVNAGEILGGAWTIENGVIKLGNTVIYQAE